MLISSHAQRDTNSLIQVIEINEIISIEEFDSCLILFVSTIVEIKLKKKILQTRNFHLLFHSIFK